MGLQNRAYDQVLWGTHHENDKHGLGRMPGAAWRRRTRPPEEIGPGDEAGLRTGEIRPDGGQIQI